jgi:hypothetical protein
LSLLFLHSRLIASILLPQCSIQHSSLLKDREVKSMRTRETHVTLQLNTSLHDSDKVVPHSFVDVGWSSFEKLVPCFPPVTQDCSRQSGVGSQKYE